eukprot:Plantae.Rhodophyta-Hildenbrandia_rubra.ctg15581.p1 GENE.Plantae.Rhodophyta-Hildenbrandia_rubra.ctg15581~~Plantae.Rhodophyta-Hildenbrandia_rubra.ctg15581.p1  ORF type:complete len:544 (+),score=67.58 Plantae.Rhodophyta-Hildenbrandia_rubra.ctg15581:254-1885(+)
MTQLAASLNSAPTCTVATPHPSPLALVLPANTSPLSPQNLLSEQPLKSMVPYVTFAIPVPIVTSEQQPILRRIVPATKGVTQKLKSLVNETTQEVYGPEWDRFGYWRVRRGFGTKSAYFHPPAHHHDDIKSPYSCGGGSIIHVSLLARHGTRNPTRGHLSRLRDLETFLYEQIGVTGDGGTGKPTWLTEFSMRIEEWEKGPGAITEEGVKELRLIGQRFRQRYQNHLSPESVKVRSSYKARAIFSAKAFLEGYGKDDVNTIIDILEHGERDSSLRFYDAEWNARYATFVTTHKKAMKKAPYGNDQKAQEIAQRITNDLGCEKVMQDDHLRRLVEYCAIERAQKRIPISQLSSMFTAEDLLHLATFEGRYTPFFNGHKLHDTLAAPLLEDLLHSIQQSVRKSQKTANSNSNNGHAAKDVDMALFNVNSNSEVGKSLEEDHSESYDADLRFAHAETLIPLLLLMGIRGVDGTHDLGALSPFAGNLMIELWAPPPGGPNSNAGHRVRIRLHEQYVERIEAIDGGDQGWLDVDTLVDFFSNVIRKTL